MTETINKHTFFSAGLYNSVYSVIREESNRYEYKPDSTQNIVVIDEDGNEFARFPMERFMNESETLLNSIKGARQRTFTVPSAESFMSQIGCSKLKAPSRDKADIHIVIHDLRTNITPLLGFSIKSQLGSASTLLNASKATNFCYCISGCSLTDAEIKKINDINTHHKILDRVKTIISKNGVLEYAGMDDSTFKNNLVLIDSFLPPIIASVLAQCYSTGVYDLKKNTEQVSKSNPMGYDINDNLPYYEHKIKNLLVASALGMVPHTPWNALYDANGGYLVVKDDGDVLCYHFYDRNLFESYLFENTKLETPSSSRNDFGKIFKGNDGRNYIKLNLQIRFK